MKKGNDFQFLIDKSLLEKAKREARKKRISFSQYVSDLLLESLDESNPLYTKVEKNTSLCSIYLKNDLKKRAKEEAEKKNTSVSKIICFLLQKQVEDKNI
jgi:predicted HicB family RNase H-like nuclease